jgi:hypothetical protein
MTTEQNGTVRSADLIQHLLRFPEDLRDIRRLQRRFGLTAAEVARALETWRTYDGGAQHLKRMLTH